MNVKITSDLEFFEVLNEFPNLKYTFDYFKLDINIVSEGISIHDFLIKSNLKEEDISIILRKVNRDLSYFLKKEENLEIRDISLNDTEIANLGEEE